MRTLRVAVLAVALPLVLATAPAGAKQFGPGDLRICNAKRCIPIVDPGVVKALSSFYYVGPAPAEVRAPSLGTPYLMLSFRNGYVTGVAATPSLDRFRSRGVNLGRFGDDDWYRIPAKAAAGLRRAASGLLPLRANEWTLGPRRHW